MNKAVFLDRDGVINRKLENDYVKKWDEFCFLPGVFEAIKAIKEKGYLVIIDLRRGIKQLKGDVIFMLVVKGIYDGNQIKLLEPVKIEGEHFVEVRFIEEVSPKEQQLKAFQKARGIWKERHDVDVLFSELEERWQQWRKNLEVSA